MTLPASAASMPANLLLPFENPEESHFRFAELWHRLGVSIGRLPPTLVPDEQAFEALWARHPPDYPLIMMHGRLVPTPRWNQAYGQAYTFSGRTYPAEPVPAELGRFLDWGRATIDSRLNGLVVNWYDAREGHYIGAHRDYRDRLVPGAPIVTISFGEERPFRFRPWKGKGYVDFAAPHGAVFVIPYETNLVVTHEVPLLRHHHGRRISVTLRAFV